MGLLHYGRRRSPRPRGFSQRGGETVAAALVVACAPRRTVDFPRIVDIPLMLYCAHKGKLENHVLPYSLEVQSSIELLAVLVEVGNLLTPPFLQQPG
jgi:hypothetical protein